jgi:hypothetical protein
VHERPPLLRRRHPDRERHVERLVHGGAVEVGVELAEVRGELHRHHVLDEALPLAAGADDVGDAAHAQSRARLELLEVREEGRLAVVAEDHGDHRHGPEAREPAEVHGALGLARADEDAAGAGAEGVDVARPHEVLGAAGGIDGLEDGGGAVPGGLAGPDPLLPVEGHGEGGVVERGVARHLGGEVQLVGPVLGKAEAHLPAGLLEEEVDGLGGDLLRRHDEVALVLPAGVVLQDHHLPRAQVVEDVLDGAVRHRFAPPRPGRRRRGDRNRPTAYSNWFLTGPAECRGRRPRGPGPRPSFGDAPVGIELSSRNLKSRKVRTTRSGGRAGTRLPPGPDSGSGV